MKPRQLTVIFGNEWPLLTIGEPVSHRRVTVDLTPEQAAALTPKWVGRDRERDCYESFSLTFLED